MKTFVIASYPEARVFLQESNAAELEKWSSGSRVYAIGPDHILLCGIGKEAAKNSLNRYLSKYHPDELINLGTAGSLNSSANQMDLIWPSVIYDDPAGYYWNQHAGEVFTLVTVPEPIDKLSDKNYLHRKYRADAVDMEAAQIVYCAIKYNLKWRIAKVITDLADENSLTDFKAVIAQAAQIISNTARSL